MGKQQLDKAKQERSRQWLREAGAKSKVEALVGIEPDLKLRLDTVSTETIS